MYARVKIHLCRPPTHAHMHTSTRTHIHIVVHIVDIPRAGESSIKTQESKSENEPIQQIEEQHSREIHQISMSTPLAVLLVILNQSLEVAPDRRLAVLLL